MNSTSNNRESSELLKIEELHVSFATHGGTIHAVRGVTFHVMPGECLALVGESGCGKTVTAHSIINILPKAPTKARGHIWFNNRDVFSLSEREMLRIRGSQISMIFQDPMTYLNPTMTIGHQIYEMLRKHNKSLSRKQAKELCLMTLNKVGVPNAERRYNQFPHEFSGGMRQRVLIGMAVICKPKLIIADEPTTALDVTTQAQVLKLINDLIGELQTSLLLITHDLGVVAQMAHRIEIIYAGRIVETGTARDIFKNPQHPYTYALLRSIPSPTDDIGKPLYSIAGTPPDLFQPPAGCAFAARCKYCMKVCEEHQPLTFAITQEHSAACWLLHPKVPYRMPTGRA
jgi:oligopeptide transport system ATP-binding protein